MSQSEAFEVLGVRPTVVAWLQVIEKVDGWKMETLVNDALAIHAQWCAAEHRRWTREKR